MTGMRSYDDPCGIARALDLVGERWALLVVRELLFGPKRFTDLRAALGASPNVLSQRLTELEEGGIVGRRAAGGAVYELTERGQELHPILVALGRWGARANPRRAGTLGVDALMVALEACFVPSAAADMNATYELRVDEERFSVAVDRGTLAIARGSSPKPDAVLTTDAATLRAVVFGDRKLADATLDIRGDARSARAFLRLFQRP
ncbi:MAG: transcriptional regulator [Deltaproteobacteria bacterium]|nr:transcriptional regulator [Deltaproteobacteria bacterium]